MITPPAGLLSVVATPIGRLDDITLRAIEVLRGADRVVAEDTRRTRALLSHLGISGKPLEAVEAHADDARIGRVVARLVEGEKVALVTDAGSPAVSDPGAALVRAAVAAGVRVEPVPGPSAVTAALSVAAFGGAGFRFFGFLPRSGGARRDALERVCATEEPAVLFEAPSRMAESLNELAALQPERPIVVARELTKLHEEIVRGTLAEVAAEPREWIGEITVVLGPHAAVTEAPSDEAIEARIDAELGRGAHAREAADRVAAWSGLARREIYARVVARRTRG